LNRPVVIGALAERDIREARAWFEEREPGLGDQFFERVKETVRRIASNPEIYRTVFGDARRAPVKSFQYSVWFRIAPDASIVVACLSDRRDLSLAKRGRCGSSRRKPSQIDGRSCNARGQ
jgi:plasmid stabilization system protein ParE